MSQEGLDRPKLHAAAVGDRDLSAPRTCFKPVNSNGPQQYIGGWRSSQFPPTNPDWDSFGSSRRVIAGLHDSPQSHGLSVEFPKLRALRPSTRDMWTFGRRYSALTTPSSTTNTITFRAAERTGARRMTDGSSFSIQSLIAVHLSLTSSVRGKYPEIDYSYLPMLIIVA